MLICPVCKNSLIKQNNVYSCQSGHSFDISKKGYVNLLISQKSSLKIQGDDKLMTEGRKNFLSKGFYKPLADKLCSYAKGCKTIVDIGCGEGYYTECLFLDNNLTKIIGIDISKTIINAAASRIKNENVVFAVAGSTNLPIQSESTDLAISVFAPITASQVHRILKIDGRLVRVTAGKNHLIELKKSLYDKPRLNDSLDMTLEKLSIVSTQTLEYKFTVNNQDLLNLFSMTPYYYKTSPNDKNKLSQIENLEITAHFDITEYKKAD